MDSSATRDLFDGFNTSTDPVEQSKIPLQPQDWLSQFDMSDHQTLLNGDASYWPQFLPTTAANQCLNLWHEQLPWQQNTIKIYGKEVLIPRYEAWLGVEGLSYQYSGQQLQAQPWPTSLATLAAALSTLTKTSLNSVLANLYRSGGDSMGWHADDEIELGPKPVIASLTLGAERDFAFREKGQSRMHSKVRLAHGSLLIMHAGMQESWQHALPKRSHSHQPRLNLTFRQIIES